MLLPQRYIFSSKSQPLPLAGLLIRKLLLLPQRYIFSSKSQLNKIQADAASGCCCYHKGTYFQANHNTKVMPKMKKLVVVATTKVHIFKQITTGCRATKLIQTLLLLPQRYIFSSKSQRMSTENCVPPCCCCYHKGTYFQANHNKVKLTLH